MDDTRTAAIYTAAFEAKQLQALMEAQLEQSKAEFEAKRRAFVKDLRQKLSAASAQPGATPEMLEFYEKMIQKWDTSGPDIGAD